jgi:AraC family transcriptional regulator
MPRGTDSLGCLTSDLLHDDVLCVPDMVFRRKAASGRHVSHVETPAQDRGLLIGISLSDGHDRSSGAPGQVLQHRFNRGDIYIRDFDSDYHADMDGNFDFFLIELPQTFLQDSGRLDDHPCKQLARILATEDQVLRHLALALLPALSQPETFDALLVEQLSSVIGAHLLHRHRDDGLPMSEARYRLPPRHLRRAQELLMEGGDQMASIARIAETLHMSRNSFLRAFRESVGATPYQWLLSQRIDHARRLLSGTDLPLVEIALACGFFDQSHFTRTFSRAEGLSPGRWRRRIQ